MWRICICCICSYILDVSSVDVSEVSPVKHTQNWTGALSSHTYTSSLAQWVVTHPSGWTSQKFGSRLWMLPLAHHCYHSIPTACQFDLWNISGICSVLSVSTTTTLDPVTVIFTLSDAMGSELHLFWFSSNPLSTMQLAHFEPPSSKPFKGFVKNDC